MHADSEILVSGAARILGRRDAELLFAAAAGWTRVEWIARSRDAVPPAVAQLFAELVARRADGVPVAYLLGRREFWSLDFEITPAVLVPRPETELLVERALARVAQVNARVADLGTGSGAIAIALAHERPDWSLVGIDVSDAALTVARRNGERLAPGRVEWRLNDSRNGWFGQLAGRAFEALVSNPPYIAADDAALQADGLRHEPRGALTPEGDGFAALATLINGAPDHLVPGGWLLLEHGQAQGLRTRETLVARGFTHVTSHRDLAGHERVSEAQWPN